MSISRARLVEFWEQHPDVIKSLTLWYKRMSGGEWQNLADLRDIFPSADSVGNFTVFNIGGNKYRLITLIDYKHQKIFIRHVLTHAAYDRDDWKQDPWYE